MKACDMAAHVFNLCQQHGITIESHSSGGRSYRQSKRIMIRPVKTSITYAVAMHEIGHVLGKQGKYRLEKEKLAWDWAMANAKVWTDVMERKMDKCLESYYKWAARHKTMRTI
jgi:hypothetical protein